MKHNMGTADRITRILAAVAVVIFYLTNIITGALAYVLLAVAAIFILSSIAGSCPLYSLFGIKTCNTKSPN